LLRVSLKFVVQHYADGGLILYDDVMIIHVISLSSACHYDAAPGYQRRKTECDYWEN